MGTQTPIAEGLFRLEGDVPVLLATRRRSTGAIKFPQQSPDVHGPADDMETIELTSSGTLYTFTTQEFPPPVPYVGEKSRDGFTPYVVGFVELAEGVLIESLIVGAKADELEIGDRMTVTSTELRTVDDDVLLTFAFRPSEVSK